MSKGREVRAFILAYIAEQGSTDATDQEFHERFFQRFGGKRQETVYGAQMVYKAQRWLAKMHRDGELNRRVFSIGEAPADGFPAWVYGYTIR